MANDTHKSNPQNRLAVTVVTPDISDVSAWLSSIRSRSVLHTKAARYLVTDLTTLQTPKDFHRAKGDLAALALLAAKGMPELLPGIRINQGILLELEKSSVELARDANTQRVFALVKPYLPERVYAVFTGLIHKILSRSR